MEFVPHKGMVYCKLGCYQPGAKFAVAPINVYIDHMYLVTANKARQLLCTSCFQRVTPDEIRSGIGDIKLLLPDLRPGFHLLVDFSQVETIDLESAAEIGILMELLDRHGVGMVVRVVPDPDKDIGMNILSVFHYPHHPRIVTCKTMAEALRALKL